MYQAIQPFLLVLLPFVRLEHCISSSLWVGEGVTLLKQILVEFLVPVFLNVMVKWVSISLNKKQYVCR